MVCPSMPICASTELPDFCIFRVAKELPYPFWRPLCWHPGAYAPSVDPGAAEFYVIAENQPKKFGYALWQASP